MAPSALPSFIAASAGSSGVLLRPALGLIATIALAFVGNALRARYTDQLGSPDHATGQARDSCPRCGTPNPASRDRCEYCRAGLPEPHATT